MDEGLFDAETGRHYGLKWVQQRIREIRADVQPAKILKMGRPAETQRYEQQILRAMREKLAIIEDNSMIRREVVTPKGDVITVEEPRWPPAQKEKASTEYAKLAEKLALVRGVGTKGEALGEPDPDHPDEPAEAKAERFVFNFPNVKGTTGDLDAMIAMNLDRDRGKVN